MSVEWWNLDQALFWIATHDEKRVRAADGDPSNGFLRDGKWYAHTLGNVLDGRSRRPTERQMREAEARLLEALRSGKIPAIDDRSEVAVSSVWFKSAYWEPGGGEGQETGKIPIMGLACPLRESRHQAGPREWLAPLVDAYVVRKEFPAPSQASDTLAASATNNPQELQTCLSKIPNSVPEMSVPSSTNGAARSRKPTNSRPLRLRAEKAIANLRSNGTPVDELSNKELFKAVSDELKRTGQPDVRQDTILRAAGRRR
ncbi:hypothetical protein ACRBEV_05325 [Methylobacterium phyllosphaerae]